MVLEHPLDPRLQALIDRNGSLRVVQYAPDPNVEGVSGGYYRIAAITGATTVLAAGDAILSMRWDDPDRNFVLRQLRGAAVIQTAFAAAQEVSVDLVRMNGFTAPDTGGTNLTPDLNAGQGRRRTSAPPSNVADLRVAAAVALGAGTGTPESRPIAYQVMPYILNAAGATAVGDLFHAHPGDAELEFRRNEGFRIRIGVTQGAAGVVKFIFELEWAELPTIEA